MAFRQDDEFQLSEHDQTTLKSYIGILRERIKDIRKESENLKQTVIRENQFISSGDFNPNPLSDNELATIRSNVYKLANQEKKHQQLLNMLTQLSNAKLKEDIYSILGLTSEMPRKKILQTVLDQCNEILKLSEIKPEAELYPVPEKICGFLAENLSKNITGFSSEFDLKRAINKLPSDEPEKPKPTDESREQERAEQHRRNQEVQNEMRRIEQQQMEKERRNQLTKQFQNPVRQSELADNKIPETKTASNLNPQQLALDFTLLTQYINSKITKKIEAKQYQSPKNKEEAIANLRYEINQIKDNLSSFSSQQKIAEKLLEPIESVRKLSGEKHQQQKTHKIKQKIQLFKSIKPKSTIEEGSEAIIKILNQIIMDKNLKFNDAIQKEKPEEKRSSVFSKRSSKE